MDQGWVAHLAGSPQDNTYWQLCLELLAKGAWGPKASEKVVVSLGHAKTKRSHHHFS
jgi:hypothetical protein